MLRNLLMVAVVVIGILIGGCTGSGTHVLFPETPGGGEFPPHWANNIYSFWPRDGSHYVRTDSSVVIEFRGDRDKAEFLPARMGLEVHCFGWTEVRTELSPISPYKWRLDPASGSLSTDSKYRVWVETRNGWFYSAVFWTRDDDEHYYW